MLIAVDKVYNQTITNENLQSFTAIHTLNNKPLGEKNYFINIYRDLKLWITLFLFFILQIDMIAQNNFLNEQLSFERVKAAFDSKEKNLELAFKEKDLSWPPKEIFIRSFKAELELELWVKENEKYVLFRSYKVCKGSGSLGPKFEQGDKQVPEGFYFIERFNPESNFYLSLGINYPNSADVLRTDALDPGGDIFIHGSCVTVGCLPMTDEFIKELYVLCVLAKSKGQQKIPVHIYPYKFNLLNNLVYKTFSKYSDFWDGLILDFNFFQKNRQLRFYEIDYLGNYIINK